MNLNFGNTPLGANSRPDAGTSFLPEDYLRRKRERRSNFISLSLFCIVMFGVIAAFFVTNRQWTSVMAEQNDVTMQYTAEAKKIDQLSVLETQNQELREKAEIAAALRERVPRSILLAELINRMPEALTLTDLKLTGKRIKDGPVLDPKEKVKPKARSLAGAGAKPADKEEKEPAPKMIPPRFDFTIELIGLAAADSHVADYQAALKDCPLLENVDLVYTGTVKVDETERRKFRIEAKIRTTADARNIQPLHIPRDDLASRAMRGVDEQQPTEGPTWLRKHGLFSGRPADAVAPGQNAQPGAPQQAAGPDGSTAAAPPEQEAPQEAHP